MPDTTNNAPIQTQGDETTEPEATTPEAEPIAAETPSESNTAESQDDTAFSREYVEKLRKESAGYRDRAKSAETRVDELSRQLFTAKVAATGKLADATDLEYNPELLDDDDALSAAIDALTESKPHLKARKVTGDVGQGDRGKPEEAFSLLKALKGL
ncbi:hypothetical protein H7I53_10330 [Mycolicibacterium pulveris]|uniref:Scaffolding protein n=1 Tax=Mycolicibacterium pulveris TaxID=36813 RepID=A0A7I7UM00_MYCPV|nr:hypothetical protein [Mycolicibacterium pulveris]MCV6980617.1 hypothetical protein [Mycolicibacterium pulveris]BBY82020.1 hypothetical protein MPUL_31780 [Mycolicibacterium pulveris]